jgi:hypothetical protein
MTEEKVVLTGQFKGKRRNCGKMGHKNKDGKARREQQQKFGTKVIFN